MAERYDVVVVGARCAGSALATHLAREGVSVALIDRATFPSDTPSTHFFQAEGSACLGRLGVLDVVLKAGAPWLERLDVYFEGMRVSDRWYTLPTDPGPALCVRRTVLDHALVEAAAEAGAEVHTGSKVTGLVEEHGRVAGVRTVHGVRATQAHAEFRAGLVVGADGMGSTVARLVGARRYHAMPNERFGSWSYFEGATWEPPAAATLYRQGDDFVFGMPTDSGLYLAAVVPGREHLADFRADPEAGFAAHVAVSEPIAAAVASGKRAGRLHFVSEFPLYFRESAGPGWVLVGDAGHFKDPAGAQGISDALRQAERLAPAIVAGTDEALADWWAWRDRDAFEVHWFTADLGAAGRMSPVAIEMFQRLGSTSEGRRQFIDLLNHRLQPSQVLTPRRLLAASSRLFRDGRLSRRYVVGETARIVRNDLTRRRLRRRPRYEP
ncbi:MAG: NAD(P)/FAD-dependent oxidoreductase [Acidimicrobiales bacterium]